jgi:hypothetical protein
LPDLTVRFGQAPAAQHEETLVVEVDGREQTMRLHEYERVYAIPGLYDEVLRRLEYGSPGKVAELLLSAPGVQPGALRALDLAAGNGMSADPLVAAGVATLVGMDLIAAARDAALRDRPGAYAEYVAGDVGEPGLVAGLVERHGLNALVCAGGISHIPVEAFAEGWSAFPPGAWLVATAAEDLGDPGDGPYGAWVAREQAAGRLSDVHVERFRHRRAMSGAPLEYTALRARRIT